MRISVDTREKQPFVLPDVLTVLDRKTGRLTNERIEIVHETLEWGDYLCPDAPHAAVIERKKNLRELCGNLLDPRRRPAFYRELENLRTRCCFPWLLIEGSMEQLEKGPGDTTKNIKARDMLIDALHSHRVSFACLRSDTHTRRAAVGRWVAATLLSGVRNVESPCCDQIPRP